MVDMSPPKRILAVVERAAADKTLLSIGILRIIHSATKLNGRSDVPIDRFYCSNKKAAGSGIFTAYGRAAYGGRVEYGVHHRASVITILDI
jgi:hypothetical protein